MRLSPLILVAVQTALSCTTILVGKNASTDGSLFCSHTNDGDGTTDPRLVFVPAMDHPEGSMRPIFYTPEAYPRYLTRERGLPPYYPEEGQKAIEPIGHIPQVAHTYKYFEETYGAINEHQLGMGESTCSCVSWTDKGGRVSKPCQQKGETGCALMSVDTLTRLAMERETTARGAIQLMGSLAEQYGFYGADSFEGSAESLMVIDKEEGWVFHVLPHPSGDSAIWGAARVPADHVAAVTNMFVIREMDLTDTNNFMGSKDMVSLAAKYNINIHCQSDTKCDFTRTFSDGEYAHKYYSGRRTWGVYRILAPDNALNATYGNLLDDAPYPMSIPVDPKRTGHRVDLPLAIKTHRNHYENTPYDLTVGLSSGPFGTPNRYDPGQGEQQVKGNWERAISLYRTSDSFIVQTQGHVPGGGTLWFGPHVPHATTYTPFPIRMTAIPMEFQLGHQGALNRRTAFWSVRFIANLMDLKYNYMVHDVEGAQTQLETASLALQNKFNAIATHGAVDPQMFTSAFMSNALDMLATYNNLFDNLMFKYADGWVNTPAKMGQRVGYPAWWLKDVDYAGGPPPVNPSRNGRPKANIKD